MTLLETIAAASPMLLPLAGVFFLFATGGFVADYILPRIPAAERFLDNLPACRKHRQEQEKHG